MVLGGQDLESGSLLGNGTATRHRLTAAHKKVLVAVSLAAIVGVAIVTLAGGFSGSMGQNELMQREGKAAVRAHASAVRNTRGHTVLQSKFNTLQNKIESDLGMEQQEARAQQQAAPRSAEGLYSWRNAPRGSTDDDAQSSATLNAARAQDAYHRIRRLWHSASNMRNDVHDHLEQARDEHEQLEDEIDRVNRANGEAQDALREAQYTLQEADYLKHQQAAAEEHTARAAQFSDNAVHAIQNYLQDAFSMAKAVSEQSGETKNELEGELNSAKSAVSALSQFAEYGNHAALASQHYAAAARLFALHAAGSAETAEHAVDEIEEASMQSAFQAIQAHYGTAYAEQVMQHAQIGGYYARDLTDACMHHAYAERYGELPSDPVERAKDLIETMAPILSRAADMLEGNQGDCNKLHDIIEQLRVQVKPLNEEGNEDRLTAPEITEVQSYAEQALGSTLERLMLEVMKAVQACGPEVAQTDSQTNPYTLPADDSAVPEAAPADNEDNNDDYYYNQEDDRQSPDYNDDAVYENGDDASVTTAKQLVDSRAYVITNMISSMRASLTENECDKIRDITIHARDDFNYFEKTEMEVMENMPPEDVENVDRYAQSKLMPLLQSSLNEFNAAKDKCGREIFTEMPEGPQGDEIPSGGVIEDGDKPAAAPAPAESDAEEKPEEAAKPEHKPTALTISARAVIDHMAADITTLRNQIEENPADCKGAEAAGVAFKAKFKALEHIAEDYETRMTPEEKAATEQYAEDSLGEVMQELFTAVMHTSSHCGPSAFSMDGGQDVEDFYDEEEQDTINERNAQSNGLVEPSNEIFDESAPEDVTVNPDAERHVAQMKDRVAELKKRLARLRSKFESASSASGSAASGSAASSASAGSAASASAASGAASAAASGASAASGAASAAASGSASAASA